LLSDGKLCTDAKLIPEVLDCIPATLVKHGGNDLEQCKSEYGLVKATMTLSNATLPFPEFL